jgi:hypothetical protein
MLVKPRRPEPVFSLMFQLFPLFFLLSRDKSSSSICGPSSLFGARGGLFIKVVVFGMKIYSDCLQALYYGMGNINWSQ